MVRKMSRGLAVFLSGMILFAAFTGCGRSNTEENKKASTEQTPKKQVKLKWFQTLDGKAAATMKSYGEVAGWKVIQEKTGVEIEWMHPPVGQEKEQFNLMLASRDLPDVIYWNWSNVSGGPGRLLQDNILLKLNDLVAKSVPNYKKVLDANPEARKQTILDDGSQYMFARLFPNPESMSYQGYQLRQDWLDKLGLKVPATIEEWHTVLTAFRIKDPNGDGKNDEIPFLSDKNAGFQQFAAAWGLRRGFYPDPATRKIKYGALEPAYKDFLAEMVKWYKEGLIDSEFASVDGKNFETKMTTNKGGAYYGSISGNMGRFLNLMTEKDPKFNIVGAPWPKGPAGKPYSTHDNLIRIFVGEGAAITVSSKVQEAAARLLDFCYGPEGQMLLNWGVEGESYVKENGKYRMTDKILKNPNGLPIDQAIIQYAFPSSAAPAVCDHEARAFINYGLPQQKDASKVWAAGDNTMLLPIVYPTAEETSALANVMNEINTYDDEMFLKFIMGQESLDNFDKYVQKLKGMGIDKAIQIQQAALDRYNARK